MTRPNGIPCKVTKVRGCQAFVMPQTEAPSPVAKGDWFRVLCAKVGDEGVLIAPTPGARLQQWLFAPAKMNLHWQEDC